MACRRGEPGDHARTLEGGADSVTDGTPDEALIAEAHFGLRWMNVDIHIVVSDRDGECSDRVPPNRQLRLVGVHDGESKRAALHPAAVDENGDRCAVAAV